MKVVINTATEIEVELPAFRKLGASTFYKVVNETTAISVRPESINTPLPVSALEGTELCTEAEFNEAFSKTMEYLSELTFNSK